MGNTKSMYSLVDWGIQQWLRYYLDDDKKMAKLDNFITKGLLDEAVKYIIDSKIRFSYSDGQSPLMRATSDEGLTIWHEKKKVPLIVLDWKKVVLFIKLQYDPLNSRFDRFRI